MSFNNDDQLEIQFGGDEIDKIVARGWWEDAMTRNRFLRNLSAGIAGLGVLSSAPVAAAAGRRAKDAAAAVPGKGKKIAAALNGFNEYDQCAATGILRGLHGTQYKLILRQENFDTKQEIPIIQDLVAQRPDGITIQPSTVAGSCRGAQVAKQGGVKVVQNQFWFQKTPCDSIFSSLLEWNNIAGGHMVADFIKKAVPGGGDILHVSGIPGQGFSTTFAAGIQSVLGSKWPIVATEPGLYSRSTAISVTQTMLTAHPQAKVIVSDAAEMGTGVASYLQRIGRKDIVNITSDSNHELVQYLRNGFIAASRYVSPYQGGFISVMSIRQALETGHVAHAVPQPQQMITKADLTAQSNSYLINPHLSPASGYICYDPLLRQVQKL